MCCGSCKKRSTKRRFKTNTLKDSPSQLGENIANEILYLSNLFEKKKPDILVLMGDRYEILAPVPAAIPFNLPIVHFYGGCHSVLDTIQLPLYEHILIIYVCIIKYNKKTVKCNKDNGLNNKSKFNKLYRL